jgi:hypothetical protein
MHKLYMNVFRWKKAAFGTKAASVGGLVFLCGGLSPPSSGAGRAEQEACLTPLPSLLARNWKQHYQPSADDIRALTDARIGALRLGLQLTPYQDASEGIAVSLRFAPIRIVG